jgi:threonine synthase
MKLLAQTEGIFAEAAGGIVVAGLKKLASARLIKKDQLTVAFITGAGPRTQEILSDIVQSYHVQPDLESFNQVLGPTGLK